MSNILVAIRNDIAALSEKLDNLASNLPNVDELNQKLDAQSAAIQSVQSDLSGVNTKLDEVISILSPTLPDSSKSAKAPKK